MIDDDDDDGGKIGKNIQDNDEDHDDSGVWSRECNGSNVLP